MQNRDDSDNELAADFQRRRMATIGSIEPNDHSSGDSDTYEEPLETFLDTIAVPKGRNFRMELNSAAFT